MSVPSWYPFVLLTLAAMRTWRLLALDELLDRPRRYVTRLGKAWQADGDPVPEDYRLSLASFLLCPWCLGFWVGVAWWGAWQLWPHGTLVAATVFAISMLIPLVTWFTSDTSA